MEFITSAKVDRQTMCNEPYKNPFAFCCVPKNKEINVMIIMMIIIISVNK